MEKIIFQTEQGEERFCVLDSTKLAGRSFILVSDVEEGDGSCYILEEISSPDSGEAVYEMLDDEELLDYLANIFGEQTEDFDIVF